MRYVFAGGCICHSHIFLRYKKCSTRRVVASELTFVDFQVYGPSNSKCTVFVFQGLRLLEKLCFRLYAFRIYAKVLASRSSNLFRCLAFLSLSCVFVSFFIAQPHFILARLTLCFGTASFSSSFFLLHHFLPHSSPRRICQLPCNFSAPQPILNIASSFSKTSISILSLHGVSAHTASVYFRLQDKQRLHAIYILHLALQSLVSSAGKKPELWSSAR